MRWRDALPLIAVAPLVAAGIGGVGDALYLNWKDAQPTPFLILAGAAVVVLLAVWIVVALLPHWEEE